MGEEEAPEPGSDIPASIIGDGNTGVEISQNACRDLRMVEIKELEALPSEADAVPVTPRLRLSHTCTPYLTSQTHC